MATIRTVVPNGTLCGGGKSLYQGFDLARADWAATPWAPGTDGLYEFRYYATAPHATQYMRFYLTKQGFDPALRPLQWTDLEQVAEVPRAQIVTTADARYVVKLRLPARNGRHVVYMIWQRVDSQEAFYSCSDVTFGTPTTPPSPTQFRHLGQIAIQASLRADSTLTLRVFGLGGVDLEKITSAGNSLGQLATRVNAVSAYVRVGALQDNAVTVPPNATVLQVYGLPGATGVTYQLDTALGPIVPTPSGSWLEGATYLVAQIVTYNGTAYKCLQAHTAWNGAGWFPSAAGVIDVLWKKL